MGQGSGVATKCDAGYRCGSDLVWLWLWLWCRPAAAALIQSLALDFSCATGVALNRKKKKKKRGRWVNISNQAHLRNLKYVISVPSELCMYDHFLEMENTLSTKWYSRSFWNHPEGRLDTQRPAESWVVLALSALETGRWAQPDGFSKKLCSEMLLGGSS